MLDELDNVNDIDITIYRKKDGLSRTTREDITPRVYLIKTEQIYHKYHTSSYANVIRVDKYIDDTLVNSYSWIQQIEPAEVDEFFKDKAAYLKEKKRIYDREYNKNRRNNKPKISKPKLTEEERKQKNREKAKAYYLRNKDKVNERKKKYYEEHKDDLKQYHKQYYQDHLDYFKNYNKSKT